MPPGLDADVLLIGLGVIVLLGLAVWIAQSIYFPSRRRGRWCWPVRPETVGPTMWQFVRPKVVIIAVVIQGIAALRFFFPPPWPDWIDPAFFLLVFFAMLFTLYRTEVRGMPEGWVRYRPKAGDVSRHDRAAHE